MMSNNEEHNEQGSQDAGSAVNGSVAKDNNVVPPLDLNLDLDLVSSPGTHQRVSRTRIRMAPRHAR